MTFLVRDIDTKQNIVIWPTYHESYVAQMLSAEVIAYYYCPSSQITALLLLVILLHLFYNVFRWSSATKQKEEKKTDRSRTQHFRALSLVEIEAATE